MSRTCGSPALLGSGRSILSVIAPHSGSGKTAFVAHLVRHIQGLGCLKISPAHDWPETRGAGDPPGLPGGEPRASARADSFLEDTSRLNEPGQDTALYLAAGAVRVERLRHRRQGLPPGLAMALKRFHPATPLVVESSSAVRLLMPVAVVMVVRPPIREMKPSTKDVLSSVTDLLVNAGARLESRSSMSSPAEAERLLEEFPALRPTYTWSADLIREPPPAKMLRRLQRLLHRDSPRL